MVDSVFEPGSVYPAKFVRYENGPRDELHPLVKVLHPLADQTLESLVIPSTNPDRREGNKVRSSFPKGGASLVRLVAETPTHSTFALSTGFESTIPYVVDEFPPQPFESEDLMVATVSTLPEFQSLVVFASYKGFFLKGFLHPIPLQEGLVDGEKEYDDHFLSKELLKYHFGNSSYVVRLEGYNEKQGTCFFEPVFVFDGDASFSERMLETKKTGNKKGNMMYDLIVSGMVDDKPVGKCGLSFVPSPFKGQYYQRIKVRGENIFPGAYIPQAEIVSVNKPLIVESR